MATGFQLAGFAQGMQDATKLDIAQQETDIKRETLADAKARIVRTEGDKRISDTMSNISAVLKAAADAGNDPQAVLKSNQVQQYLESAKGLARRLGRDPADLDLQASVMAMYPRSTPTAKGPQTDIGKIHADVAAGHITPEEGAAKIKNLTRPLGEVNVIEGIRQKLAAGQPLTEGETKVYDDALKADPIARLIASSLGNRASAPAAPAIPAPPKPTAPAAPAVPVKPDPMKLR